MTGNPARYGAVLFDLLTAVIDSWTLWNHVAGDDAVGQRWRARYLRLTYGAGSYVPYETLVARAASDEGLNPALAAKLVAEWDQLRPWPEARGALDDVRRQARIGVVTNCSDELGARAAALVGVPFDILVTAESAGAYKPRAAPYQAALAQLGLPAQRVLFVAGSPHDIPGAGAIGMPVWWHNRIGMPREHTPAPIAEHRTLTALPDYLTTNSA